MRAEQTRARLFKAGWATSGGVFALVYSLASQAVLSHLLAPAEFGAYLLLSSIVLGATLFGLLGADKLVVRHLAALLAKGAVPSAQILARRAMLAVSLRGAGAAVVVVTAIGVAGRIGLMPAMSSLGAAPLAALLLWIPANVLVLLIAEIYRGHQDLRGAALVASLPGFLSLIGLMVASLFGLHSLTAAVACMAIGTGTATVVSCLAVSRGGATFAGQPMEESSEAPPLASIAISASDALNYLLANMGFWLLAYLAGPQAVAAYGVAARLATLVAFPLMVANLVLPPMLAHLAADGQTRAMQGLLRSSATLTALPALLICLIFLGLGKEILRMAFGAFYGMSAGLLLVMSVGQVINVALGSCGYALVMTGNQRLVMATSALTAAVVLACAVPLVVRYGATGMACAAALGLVLQNVLNMAAVKHRLGIWTFLRFSLPSLTGMS